MVCINVTFSGKLRIKLKSNFASHNYTCSTSINTTLICTLTLPTLQQYQLIQWINAILYVACDLCMLSTEMQGKVHVHITGNRGTRVEEHAQSVALTNLTQTD